MSGGSQLLVYDALTYHSAAHGSLDRAFLKNMMKLCFSRLLRIMFGLMFGDEASMFG